MSQIYLGIMSGTSIDSIDVAAVDFSFSPFKLLATYREPYPSHIRQALTALTVSKRIEINQLGTLDHELGLLFGECCNKLLTKIGLTSEQVIAIGTHGQTVFHKPCSPSPFTLQIGDPNLIAQLTNVTTIADFRRRDIACGGQGAPLTPAFHKFAFQSQEKNRIILNLGGIANITFLPANQDQSVIGFDSGPGNTLLDNWIKQHLNKDYDDKGSWAEGGNLNAALLENLLADSYFDLPFPKSTGREYFNLTWLKKKLRGFSICSRDVQTTLTEFTIETIIKAINATGSLNHDILVCGGGIANSYLISRLSYKAKPHALYSTLEFGLHPQWVEAIAFAWLAKQTINYLPGNLPNVTGAKQASILGGIYLKNESYSAQG